jgi:branched-chain amino acid transport system ATP-binding protein
MQSILKAEKLGITFGGLKAVSDFNLTISEGELVGLIGPNGAGKTTVFNMLTGVYQPTAGTIVLNGTAVKKNRPDQLVKMGIARTFQNIRLLSSFRYWTT